MKKEKDIYARFGKKKRKCHCGKVFLANKSHGLDSDSMGRAFRCPKCRTKK